MQNEIELTKKANRIFDSAAERMLNAGLPYRVVVSALMHAALDRVLADEGPEEMLRWLDELANYIRNNFSFDKKSLN